MKKHRVFGASAALLLIATTAAQANPIVPDAYGLSGDGSLFLLIAVSALLVEFLVVRWLLRAWAKLRHVLPAFVLIHVVSFPLTTFLGLVIVWFAEIAPLVIEPLMYRWYFRKVGVEVPRLRARIVGANLTSFAAGVVGYHVIGCMKGIL